MKSACYLLLLMSLLYSCRQKSESGQEAEGTTPDSLAVSPQKTGHYWWSANLDKGTRISMDSVESIPRDSLTSSYILNRMFQLYPEIRVDSVKQYHDTLLVKIPDSRYLTSQMGSTGAYAYLAELTYNLTEVPGTSFVTILFKAGDHASPDTYSRSDFNK